MDVYPCVTDEESWTSEISIKNLFGHLCTGISFLHDLEMGFIQDVDTAQAPESSPHRNSYQSVASKSSSCGPENGNARVCRPSALDKSSPASADVSDIKSSPASSAKRRGTGNNGFLNTDRTKPRRLFPEQGRDHGVLARSFSEWLGPTGRDSLPSTGTLPKSTTGQTIFPALQDQLGLDPEGPVEPLSGRAHKLHRDLALSDSNHHRLTQNNCGYPLFSSAQETSAPGGKTRQPSKGTQSSPVELSDSSQSETERDAEQDGSTQLDKPINGPTVHRPRSETPLSVGDSSFESQESRLSNPHAVRNLDARRMQYRKEIYRAVRRDDGHLWGKEYGLVSTTVAYDEDDLEL